jgi:hypothetical protein
MRYTNEGGRVPSISGDEGRLSLVDDYGVKVTVNELRPKAYAGRSKRDAAYWLASVTVTRPNGYNADGWVLYRTDEGGAIWMRCTTSEMTSAKSDRAVNTTLMDALWLAWMRAYRVHPSGQSKARQIQQEADRAYELRRQHLKRYNVGTDENGRAVFWFTNERGEPRRDEEARRHDDK